MYKSVTAPAVCLIALTMGACSSSSTTPQTPADDDETAGPDIVDVGTPDIEPDGGDITTPDPTDVVIDVPGTDTQTASLATAIQGAWEGTCSNFESQGISVKQINAITDTQVILDFYEFDGNDCQGVPRGIHYPLRVYDYTLGSDVAAEDGITAAQIDLTVTQVSEVGYLRDGVQVADERFDIIGVDAAGNLLNTRAESSNPDNRPTSFSSALVMTPRTPLTPPSITPEVMAGTYSPGCAIRTVGSSLVTDTLDAAGTLTTVEEFHFNDDCAGEPDAATQRTIDYIFGNNGTTVFGDAFLQVISTQSPKTILYGDDALSSLDLGETRVRYDLLSLVGDTLFRGDCVVRVSDCKEDENNYADMIDFEFNSSVRYTRIQP